MATTKLRREDLNLNIADDVDSIAEHSLPRSADSSLGACTANLVINKGARSRREIGAIVEIQRRHGIDYMLTVSLHGENQYAVKADQPIETRTPDKLARSMMWRGGEDWSLEFVDRKQWQLFQNLHEVCLQRNSRAPAAGPAVPLKPIALPGVTLIEEVPNFGPPYVRPSLNYIRQYYGEADLAFSSSRIVYDMDSEDEEWLNQLNTKKVSCRGTRSRAKVDEDTFEKVIDKLEKTSFIQHQKAMPEQVAVERAVETCQDLGSQDQIMAIHSYWSEKRLRKGMSLIRYFQPTPCEQYKKQLKERDIKIDQLLQKFPKKNKRQLQGQVKKPALFAFCIGLPNELKTQNKMQKQRSCKKERFPSHMVASSDDDKIAFFLAAQAFAKAKREVAISLRSRAQALHEVADAARQKELSARVAVVIAADAFHEIERAKQLGDIDSTGEM